MKTISMWLVFGGLLGACVAGDAVQATDEAALTGSGSGSSSGSGSGVWHSSMNGGGANVGYFDGDGTSLWLNAYENGAGTSRVTALSYMFQGPDPASQVCYSWSDPWWGAYTYCYYQGFISEYGWGTIPGSDFTVTANASSARLHTTTDGSFYVERCTWSWYGGVSCGLGSSQSFDLAWNKDGAFSTAQNGTLATSMGAYTQQTSGRFVQSSARVTGTARGITLSGAYGGIQDSQGTTVSRDIFRATP
jgi:hypothetical protein